MPAGTWSDDSSLTFCLAEALTQDFDLDTIGKNLVKWYHKNFWIARGNVFDVGVTTRHAISRLANGEKPELAGSSNESESGNGSLMRMIPLLFYLFDKPINERYDITKKVSSLTHRQIRSVNACFYYLEFARQIFYGKDKFGIYRNLQTEVPNYLTSLSINPREIELFDRLLKSILVSKRTEYKTRRFKALNLYSNGKTETKISQLQDECCNGVATRRIN